MIVKEFSSRVQRIKPSETLAVAARAEALIAEGKDIINLSVGEPDFDTPDFIKKAAIEAIQSGFTKYTAVDGTLELKKAIIQKFERDNQLTYDLSQIIVSCGAKHCLYNAFTALLNGGDEVIIPAPYWVSYPDMTKLADGSPVIIKTTAAQQFKITPSLLEAAITEKTRLIVLNSPSNPTGMAYTADELHALGAVIIKYPQITVISDDIYEHTLWTNTPFANIVMAFPKLYEQTLVINGVSKAYAMTGWRIGYAAGPTRFIAAMKKIQSQSTSNPCSIAQAAALAALQGDPSCMVLMTKQYKARHDFIIRELQTISGLQFQSCDGTFYLLMGAQEWFDRLSLKNDIEFADYLLNEAGIAVVPGSAFGIPGYVRLSYATHMEKLQEAMKRLKKVMR